MTPEILRLLRFPQDDIFLLVIPIGSVELRPETYLPIAEGKQGKRV